MQPCLFCGGDASEANHVARCDGRQGAREAEVEDGIEFDYEPVKHVRRTDPDTSVAAAFQVADATEVQKRVLAIFERHPHGLTDEELIAIYQREHGGSGRSLESRASPRKRRSDLVALGLLVDSGMRRPLASGRNGIVWIKALVLACPERG